MGYKKILISCGELSGEIHSSNLVKELQKLNKKLKFFAIGSTLLKQLKCKILIDYREISIMGFSEVVKKYFYIRKRINITKKFIKTGKPDMIILVDFPGFNFIIAKYAKKFNIKVIYYIPPQIWAWNYKRIEKIRKYIDFVIPILPFEKSIYQKEHVPFAYFGHPLIDNIKTTLSKNAFYKKYNIPSNKKIIALLPGSRKQEIHHHLSYILGTAEKLEEKYDNLFFIINCAPTINDILLKQYLNKYRINNIHIIKNQNYNLLNASFAGLCVSGTVTLEATYFKLPMVVIYKVDFLFFIITRYLLAKVRFITLANLIANKEIVKEILQESLTIDNLVIEMDKIITDVKYRKTMILSLQKVRNSLGKKGVIKKIASKIAELL